MAFLDTTVSQFQFNMAQLEHKFFGKQFFNFATHNTLIGLAVTLTKILDYYKKTYNARPYVDKLFYVHVIAYINSAMEPTPENRAAMERVFDNLERVVELAESLQYAPSLEEWEPEE